MPLQAGTRLASYVVVRSLGAGGMGEVFEARDTRLDRRVAIKTLRPELLADPRALRRFEREAKALSGLNHPNVCTVFDVGHDDGIHFIVMEYIEGETLAARLDRGAFDEPLAIRYAVQIADALAEAHDRGVLHRDVKPQNVMITPRGQIKVLDFGLSKALAPEPTDAATVSGLSDAGAVLGTAPYMSPEQVRGQGVDARSDVFSLGAVIYETLAGSPPFRASSPAEAMSAVLTRDPVPLARLAPATSTELQRIVRKYTLARVYALAGNGDEAARWLEETVRWGFPCYPVFETDRMLDPVRASPRVQRVLSELKATWEQYRDAVR